MVGDHSIFELSQSTTISKLSELCIIMTLDGSCSYT